MKHLLLISCCLLAWAHPAQAACRLLAPADTVVGEAHIMQLLTQGLCTQLAMQSRHQDLTLLTREQGLGLMREMNVLGRQRQAAASASCGVGSSFWRWRSDFEAG